MDGENNGKPYYLMGWFGGKPTILGNIHMWIYPETSRGNRLPAGRTLQLLDFIRLKSQPHPYSEKKGQMHRWDAPGILGSMVGKWVIRYL